MATTFRLANNSAQFPFSYETAVRSVLTQSLDVQTQIRGSFPGQPSNVDWNLIQTVFCENVIPIARGLKSVSYRDEIAAATPAATDFDKLITIKNTADGDALFVPARGKNYVLAAGIVGWTSYNAFVLAADKELVTQAYVQGRTFIFYEGTKGVEWNPSGPSVDTLVFVWPAGITTADILGISYSSNYVIAYTKDAILWSSLANILDFADTDSGAGKVTPVDLAGPITFVAPTASGFIIYTSKNAVGATATNDASRPFLFKEIRDSGGVQSPEQAGWEANSSGHYVYGSGGLQEVNLQASQTVFPEAADFLTSKELDYWDFLNNKVVQDVMVATLQPKLQYVNNRYLIISYSGVTTHYQYALIYDTAFERWGKLRIDHVDVGILPLGAFGSSYRYYTLEGTCESYDIAYEDMDVELPDVIPLRDAIGFLAADGSVKTLVTFGDGASAVAVVGRIQLQRGKYITIFEVEVDTVNYASSPKLLLLGSDSGKDRDSVTECDVVSEDNGCIIAHSRVTAKNFDFAVIGDFTLTNTLITGTNHGSR